MKKLYMNFKTTQQNKLVFSFHFSIDYSTNSQSMLSLSLLTDKTGFNHTHKNTAIHEVAKATESYSPGTQNISQHNLQIEVKR